MFRGETDGVTGMSSKDGPKTEKIMMSEGKAHLQMEKSANTGK